MMESASDQNQETFKKIADSVIDSIRDPLAGWLFTVILRHINRLNNSLVISCDELAERASMSVKSIQRKTALLEAMGIIVIIRRKKGSKNLPNEYRLAGVAFDVACRTQRPEQATQSRLIASQSRSLTESTDIHQTHDDDEIIHDSGEFEIAGEGVDAYSQKQDIDADIYQEQEEFLHSIGIEGRIFHQLKRKSLRDLRDMWIASSAAVTNRQGYFVRLCVDGIFQKQSSGWNGASKSEYAELSWADFATN